MAMLLTALALAAPSASAECSQESTTYALPGGQTGVSKTDDTCTWTYSSEWGYSKSTYDTTRITVYDTYLGVRADVYDSESSSESSYSGTTSSSTGHSYAVTVRAEGVALDYVNVGRSQGTYNGVCYESVGTQNGASALGFAVSQSFYGWPKDQRCSPAVVPALLP